MAGGFNTNTQRYFRPVGTLAYAANQVTTAKLLNIGFLASINLVLSITFTVANGAGSTTIKTGRGKVTGNPTPFDVIKGIRFVNNQNVPIVDTSFWGLYQWTTTQRTAYNPQSLRNQTGLSSGIFGTPTTSTLANGTYTYRFPIQVPIAQKPALQSGLILMQNQQTDMRLEVAWGDTANLVTLAGGAVLSAISVSMDVEQELYMVPADQADFPDLGFTHRIIETTQDIVGTGQNDYRPPLTVNDTLVRLIQEFVNNSLPMAPTDITNFDTIFSGADYVATRNPYQLLAQNVRENGGNYSPDGVYTQAFDSAYGFPEIAQERDYIYLGALSDLTFRTNVAPSVAIVGAYMRNIREILST